MAKSKGPSTHDGRANTRAKEQSLSHAAKNDQPRGEAAGGTENMAADGYCYAAEHSGPTTHGRDHRPSVVVVADGLSVPKRVSK